MASTTLVMSYLVICVHLVPAQRDSMKLQLFKCLTRDKTITCDLMGFYSDIHQFGDLSYLRLAQNVFGRMQTLATLDLVDGRVSASKHLTPRTDFFYVVTGEKDNNTERNSWLSVRLSMADYSRDEAVYNCLVVYTESGTGLPKHWYSEAFPFVPTNITHPGIKVSVNEGFTLECSCKQQCATVVKKSFVILEKEMDRLREPDQCQNRSTHHLCDSKDDMASIVKRLHVFHDMCSSIKSYQCRSALATNKDQSDIIHCSTTTTACTAHQTASAPEPQKKWVLPVAIAVPLAGVLLLGVLICIICKLYKRKNGCGRCSNEHDLNPSHINLSFRNSGSYTLNSPIQATHAESTDL